MSIVLLKVKIKNEFENQECYVKGIFNKKMNTLTYNDGNMKNKYCYSNNSLERENNSIRFFFPFEINKETNAYFYDKEKKIKIDIKLFTKILNIKSNNLLVEYTIENNNHFKYEIEVLKIVKK